MSEDTETQTTEDQVTEPSLDDVIAEFNPQTAPQPQAQPQQVAQPQVSEQPVKVDPLDENSFNGYVNQVASGQSVLNQQLQEVRTELTELQQERARLQVEADITNAVDNLNENLKLNPKLVRVHLEMTAQEKPGFKKLWEGRQDNPKAWEKALSAVGKEMRDLYSVKQDDGLVETQAAIQQSQRSLAGKNTSDAANPTEEKLANAASDAEFDRLWNQALSGGL